jgi:hypothetical protein
MNLRKTYPADQDYSELGDALLDLYVTWREESGSVAQSYQSWISAGRDQERLAYSAYVAALDREEHAAAAYQRLVEQASDAHSRWTTTNCR